MTDDLRLRTARALNVKMYYEEEFPGERYYYYAEGERKHQPIAAYGEDWASCEEIDAAIQERGWTWLGGIFHGDDGRSVFLSESKDGRLWKGDGPTFPAALAEAFCQAVEAGDPIPSTGDVD